MIYYTWPLDLMIKVGEELTAAMQRPGREPSFRFCHRYNAWRRTLRPGPETPLWNELRARIRPVLRRHGDQAHLGRLLGLPRQRVNEFLTGGGQMPDAERTLLLLVWLAAAQQGGARVRHPRSRAATAEALRPAPARKPRLG